MLLQTLRQLYRRLRLTSYRRIFGSIRERSGSLSATEAFSADVMDIGICIFFHIQIRLVTDEIYFFPAENYAVRSGIFFIGSIYIGIFYYRSHFCFPPLCRIIRRSSFQAAAL